MRHYQFICGRLVLLCTTVSLATVVFLANPPFARAQVPGPEIFRKDLKEPIELWDAADYLVRTGQAKQAVPYLNAFLKSQPDDPTLIKIRDRYGVRSALRLEDNDATRPLAKTIVNLLNAAVQRNATRPERIERAISALAKSEEEQHYAVDRLKEAGPFAVPFLVRVLERPSLTADERVQIVRNIGRLDRSAVPPLIAALDSTDLKLVVDVADALGQIGDPRAVPQLTYVAATNAPTSPVGSAARRAIAHLTGRTFESQPRSPARVLTDTARQYHIHAIRFPSDRVLIWEWDAAKKEPAPREVSAGDAQTNLGLRLAREALQLDSTNLAAQVVLISLALEKAVEQAGFSSFPANDPSKAFASALAAGPAVLERVLRTAITDGKTDLAAVAATALGQVTDGNALGEGKPHSALVEALSAPGRRVQFAAARALVLLNPRKPFAGSSRVVPVLAWFVSGQTSPRAVVIDGNATRAGQLAGHLKSLGYDPTIASTGPEGFRIAAESADVELVLVDPHLTQGPWRLADTLANLRADARTAAIPIVVVGALNMNEKLDYLKTAYPGLKLIVQPTTAELLEQQLGGRPTALLPEERAAYAREATALLAQLSTEPGSPFEPDLAKAEAALTVALSVPATSAAASVGLGDVHNAAAQRGLADTAIDPSKPAATRLAAASQLAKSLQRFGRLVGADQEVKLLSTLDQEQDPNLHTALSSVIGALRPKPSSTGLRLQQYRPLPPQPVQASQPPGSAPSPPAEGSTPPAQPAPAPPASANP